MTTQLEQICATLLGLGIQESMFNLYRFGHHVIDEKYGEVNLVKINLGNEGKPNLLVIPGYSFKSFDGIMKKLHEGMDFIRHKYSHIYLINWGDKIKKDSEIIGKGLSQEERFRLNDLHREEMANLLDKCIRSPDVNLRNIEVLGKSAGGGVSFFFTAINPEVRKLYLVAPGITNRGVMLRDRTDIPIFISFNKDDTVIPYDPTLSDFRAVLSNHGDRLQTFLYEAGGHELNVKFLEDAVGK